MILDVFRMNDKVAIVTGASRGIGRGSAIALAEAGADVVLAARRADVLEEAAKEVRARGRRALVVPTDVTAGAELDRLLARTLEEFGRLDVLVNNAGGYPPRIAVALSDEEMMESYQFNVVSALHLSRSAAPHLARTRGAIVNISSAMSHCVDTGFVAYGAAKAALNHMTRLLAHEWAPRVRVNALAVGATMTDALEAFVGAGDMLDKMTAKTPMGRLATPEDIAASVLFLASPASSWITGKILEVDGGASASTWPYPMPGGLEDIP
ncbi:glucose 1-dehydrogenase [Polyangium sp. 15x6]|uniref:glucose 1-dehydrogenase n=1 Tax=Polyangium sp. 15x6 TaxID=3042687 RepID=UPI00249BE3C2|nr:glucose 1-dehydrogenase [Polyangium sp. 15x6]MDI3289732.1 glucose 1-dehydrogenase [Polyangium sp. 15x6]